MEKRELEKLIKDYRGGVTWGRVLDDAFSRAAQCGCPDEIAQIPMFKKLKEQALNSPNPTIEEISASILAAESLVRNNRHLVERTLHSHYGDAVPSQKEYGALFNAGMTGLYESFLYYKSGAAFEDHAMPFIREAVANYRGEPAKKDTAYA